ncbi:MAG: hypothetical protein V1817_02390, partial [Candidatus Micrarchaeota archaeon]
MEKDGEEKQMAFAIELLGRRLKRRDAADVRGIIAASKARGDYSMTVRQFYGELKTRGKNAVF